MRTFAQIMAGFPPRNGRTPTPRKGESTEQYRARLSDFLWASHVHRAVHGADPAHREDLAYMAIRRLLDEQPLPAPVAEWLVFVVAELQRRDALPRKFRGRPADSSAEFERAGKLLRFIRARQASHPKEKVIDRLGAAEAELGIDFSTIKAIYYGPAFRAQVAIERISKELPRI